MFVCSMTEEEHLVHVLSRILATHFAASQTPTLHKDIMRSFYEDQNKMSRERILASWKCLYKYDEHADENKVTWSRSMTLSQASVDNKLLQEYCHKENTSKYIQSEPVVEDFRILRNLKQWEARWNPASYCTHQEKEPRTKLHTWAAIIHHRQTKNKDTCHPN